MAQRPPSPATPPPGQQITYTHVQVTTPVEVTTVRDRRTGAIISRTEKEGIPHETRTDITKGSRISIGTRCTGPSGKPVLHFKLLPNRKSAEDAARSAGKGNTPVHHAAHGPGERSHFHPADRHGNIIKDGSHYEYPR
jgi:hypothetical protein